MSQATLNTPPTSSTSEDSPPASRAPAPSSDRLSPRSASTPINYAHRRTLVRKTGINFRLILFIAVVALPLLGVGWLMVRGLVNKGVSWHGNYAEVDLKALGNFPFDETNGNRDDIPARWRELDGKKVELKGFMYSPLSARDGNEFQFVYNVTKCCFSGPPQVQERVYAHSRNDMPIFQMDECAKIVGILHVRVVRDKSQAIHSVFDLDVQHVEALEF